MQHTETYKLNLIEKDDLFSPDPLNENMEKVERAIAAGDAAVLAQAAEADAALDQRLQVFEARHMAVGTYRPEKSLDIDLGFTPVCVIILSLSANNCSGILLSDTNTSGGRIIPNGFHITPTDSFSSTIGNASLTYGYVAFD